MNTVKLPETRCHCRRAQEATGRKASRSRRRKRSWASLSASSMTSSTEKAPALMLPCSRHFGLTPGSNTPAISPTSHPRSLSRSLLFSLALSPCTLSHPLSPSPPSHFFPAPPSLIFSPTQPFTALPSISSSLSLSLNTYLYIAQSG